MAKSKLFEYAVLYHPKPTKDAQGNDTSKPTELLKDITKVLATTDQQVGMLAAREIPPDYLDKLEDVEIVVRPF